MLTAKQELFCQNIANGFTQTEAYKRAYNSENMIDATISNSAYKLMTNDAIAARIQQLRDRLAEILLFPRIERLTVLKDIAQNGEKDSDKINAIKAVGDMLGDNAPRKMQIEHTEAVHDKPLEELTDDELANIATSGG